MTKARTGRSLALGLLLVVVTGGCTGSWQQLKTRRFTGYWNTSTDLHHSMTVLEYSYSVLAAFFPKADVGTVEVLFIPPVDQMLTFGADREGLVLPQVPGAGNIGRRNLIVVSEAAGYNVATPLLSHLFLHKVVPNAPLWLHQSVAMYFRTAAVQAGNNRWRACLGFPGPVGSRLIQAPLAEFFALTWQGYPNSNPTFHDGTGRLLINFIFHGDNGAHTAKLPAIFAGAAMGTPGPQIMASTFPGMTLEQLDRRLSDFQGSMREQRERGIECPLALPIEGDNIPDEAKAQGSPAPAQDVQQLMEALKKLPHGDRFPSWYPPEVLGLPAAKT